MSPEGALPCGGGGGEMLFFIFFFCEGGLTESKDPTAAGIKTCHCDSKRVYAEMNNNGEKFGKRE